MSNDKQTTTASEGSVLKDKDGKTVKTIPVSPYGEPEFSRPENAIVNDRRGGKSTLAVNVLLPVKSIGAILPCAVWAGLTTEGLVKFDPGLPKGVKMADDYRDIFRAHINTALLKWSGRERAFSEAYARLTAAPRPKGEKPKMSEPLTWKPSAAPQTATGTDGQ